MTFDFYQAFMDGKFHAEERGINKILNKLRKNGISRQEFQEIFFARGDKKLKSAQLLPISIEKIYAKICDIPFVCDDTVAFVVDYHEKKDIVYQFSADAIKENIKSVNKKR